MTTNTYLIKAIDSYPYDIETCYESLSYALSYDDENPAAHCLMGRLHMEYFKSLPDAETSFEQALASNLGYLETYYPYIFCLIEMEKYKKAASFIEFALKQKSINKAWIYELQAQLNEAQMEFKDAIKAVDISLLHVKNDDDERRMTRFKERLEKKLKLKQQTKKKKGATS